MRNLVLVTLTLQLLLTFTGVYGLNFGDMVSFKRTCGVGCSYQHFAIYVGNEPIPGTERKPGQDIFQRIGPKPGARGDCGFGVLAKEKGELTLETKLDEYFKKELNEQDYKDRVKKRIAFWLVEENCGTYDIATNNCEHLATDVRYGQRFSKQAGTRFAKVICQMIPRPQPRDTCDKYDKMLEEIRKNAETQSSCETRSRCPDAAG